MRDIKTIFVGTDFTELGNLAVGTAVELANALHAERIHLVHVTSATPAWVGGPGDIPTSSLASTFRAISDGARASLEELRTPPTTARITREVRVGATVRELALAVEEQRADLAVIVSHRRGRLGRFVLGSVASALVRVSPCPMLVVGEDRKLHSPMRNIIAAIDDSPITPRVVEEAIVFAKKSGARVRVLSVFDRVPFGPPFAWMLDEAEQRYRTAITELVARVKKDGVELEVSVVGDVDIRQAILKTAASSAVDLLVIGTSGHSAWQRFVLGSTATSVLAEAACPVLVVPTTTDHTRSATQESRT